MKHLLLILILSASCLASGQKPGAIQVVTHNRVTIVTNPATGEKSYARWGVFPAADVPVRKIVLHLTLGTPDSMKTAHWDYRDNVFARRLGGVSGPSGDYEIARMLTPYGSIFGKGWQFEWTLDVTDFSSILRDSVEIEYRHTGYEPDTVGWALTLDFEVITGPEIVKPLHLVKLWRGNYKYGDPAEKIEEKLLPITFITPEGAGLTRFRILQTGHGMDEPRGCSEFCPRRRELLYDSLLIQQRVLWKDCGANPLYPQGGTWVYDRAGWCPGDLVRPDIIDVPATPGNHTVTVKMEPYTATGNIQAVENICGYLFHTSQPLRATDAALEEIIVPNSKAHLNRFNPAGFEPRIMIRNLGREPLQSLSIVYGTVGFGMETFQWRGNLSFNESIQVTLPGNINGTAGRNTFSVTITDPNGRADAWADDNHLTSEFTAPPLLPTGLIVRFKTNSHPGDNKLYMVSASQDTVYLRLPGNLKADTIYTDTLRLNEGLYNLVLTDTAGDGLEFWAEPDQGNGYLRLLDLQGRLLNPFQSDCGNGLFFSFSASRDFIRDTSLVLNTFSLYPRKVRDKTELEVISDRPAKMTVIITRDGKVVERHEYDQVLSGTFPFYLGYLPKGRIVLEALLNGKSSFKGRIFRDL